MNKHIIRAEHDGERCQHVGPKFQCNMKRVGSEDYCIYHGGQGSLRKEAETGLNNLRITIFNSRRISELTQSDKVFSLFDEIAILRMMLEETLNLCTSPTNLLIQTNNISELIIKIERLVSSCQKMEHITGQYLSQAQLSEFATKLIGIISEICPDHLDKIIEAVETALE